MRMVREKGFIPSPNRRRKEWGGGEEVERRGDQPIVGRSNPQQSPGYLPYASCMLLTRNRVRSACITVPVINPPPTASTLFGHTFVPR